MAATNESWSEKLTQGYLALRAGSASEAAHVFASVAMKAPPEVARVARLEIRARFLEKALSPTSDEHALLFEQVLDKTYPGLAGDSRDLVRQACKAVLQELQEEGRVIVLGPLFMTKYAFSQKKVRLIGILSESEKGYMEWGKALDYVVGGGKGTLVGRQEWRIVAKLLREGGALTCTSSRVQVTAKLLPVDLLFEWITLTGKPLAVNTPLSTTTGARGTLDESTFNSAKEDSRFVCIGPYLWLASLAHAVERKFLKALDTMKAAIDITRWCHDNLPGGSESRGRVLMPEFVDALSEQLAVMARSAGLERLGKSVYGKAIVTLDVIAQHIGRSKKADTSFSEIREALGLRGSSLDGRLVYKIHRVLTDSGYSRIRERYIHRGRVAGALRTLLQSGVKEPLAWQDAVTHLARTLKVSLSREQIRDILAGDTHVAANPDGVYSSSRKASPEEIRQAALDAMGDQGFASDADICGRLESFMGKISTPCDLVAALKDQRLCTRISGGWAFAPEFDWIAETRGTLLESSPGAWANGMIGFTNALTDDEIVTGGEAGRSPTLSLIVTGGDIVNSRLKLSARLRRMFPEGRFVARLLAGSGSVIVRGDSNAGLVQMPIGFWSVLGISHGDLVRLTRLEGWPVTYKVEATGDCRPEMRDEGADLAMRFARLFDGQDIGLAGLVEAVLEEARIGMTACEIHDVLRLGGFKYEHRSIVNHLGAYRYFSRDTCGAYRLNAEKRRQYLLRIAELESHVRKLKDESRQAETMILAFRGENARLKNENREMRNRLSSLEMDRLKSGEALQNAKKAIENLNGQVKTLTRQANDLAQRASMAESAVEELTSDNRRLKREIEKPLWRKLLDSAKSLFSSNYGKRGLSL